MTGRELAEILLRDYPDEEIHIAYEDRSFGECVDEINVIKKMSQAQLRFKGQEIPDWFKSNAGEVMTDNMKDFMKDKVMIIGTSVGIE